MSSVFPEFFPKGSRNSKKTTKRNREDSGTRTDEPLTEAKVNYNPQRKQEVVLKCKLVCSRHFALREGASSLPGPNVPLSGLRQERVGIIP